FDPALPLEVIQHGNKFRVHKISVRRQKRVGHRLPLQSSNGLGLKGSFWRRFRQVAKKRQECLLRLRTPWVARASRVLANASRVRRLSFAAREKRKFVEARRLN